MATNSIGVNNLNLSSGTNFLLTISNFSNLNFFIQSSNLPGVGTSPKIIPTPVGDSHHAGDHLQYETLDVKFIVDESLQNWLVLYNWLRALSPTHVIDAQGVNQYKDRLENGELYSPAVLYVTTNSNNLNVKITFNNLFPIRLSSLPFDVTYPDDKKIFANCSFAYDWYDIEVNPTYNPISEPDNVIK
jgi:hypothetical protein